MGPAQRGNAEAVAEYQARLAEVWAKYDCNPFKSILGALAQAPLFIGFFSALRALALAKVLCVAALLAILALGSQPDFSLPVAMDWCLPALFPTSAWHRPCMRSASRCMQAAA
jgi:membrane protein insertase Oxa1/YidC/SpoIIIJ